MPTGKSNLKEILKTLEPILDAENSFVFCTVKNNFQPEFQVQGSFVETEGKTLIVTKSIADSANLQYDSVFSKISLKVHSSLESVGLTAVFSNALGKAGISCNVVAAYYHDHIFVPESDASRAMETLEEIQRNALRDDDRQKDFNVRIGLTLCAIAVFGGFVYHKS